jgi:hypothetical protein
MLRVQVKGECLMVEWGQVGELIDRVPSGVWGGLAVANVVLTIGTWSVARRRLRRAGERVADPGVVSGRARTKDTALTVAALVPAGLFWAMVLAGSLHGLVAFGRDVLGWRDGWEYLVPGTLDGVSVTFAFLAFRAVRKQKAPDRCYRVVWGAAVASATVNFAYEYADSGHNVVAGGYVALLSLCSGWSCSTSSSTSSRTAPPTSSGRTRSSDCDGSPGPRTRSAPRWRGVA